MKVYNCSMCGYVYREERGEPRKDIPPNTKFEDLPDSFRCPTCNHPKMVFIERKD